MTLQEKIAELIAKSQEPVPDGVVLCDSHLRPIDTKPSPTIKERLEKLLGPCEAKDFEPKSGWVLDTATWEHRWVTADEYDKLTRPPRTGSTSGDSPETA